MFNPQARSPDNSTRSLVFGQALAAAFKAHRQTIPQVPSTLPALLDGCRNGVTGLMGKPGCRDALCEIRARLFEVPGRDAEAQTWWHEALATAVFAARVAQLKHAEVGASFLAALLHRAGEALALKVLARVELDYRMRLDSAARREWCAGHSPELLERLIRRWNLTPEAASSALGWMRFGEFAASSAESTALYFGRLFAIEMLEPEFCVPRALDHAASEVGLGEESVAQVRGEAGNARELIRALG